MNKEILYIVIPAYNEEKNIEAVINEWYPVVKRHDGGGLSRLVIVNDGSTDNTRSLAKACTNGRDLLKIITKKNAGHGRAVLCGYSYAVKNNADYVFQTDSDRQTTADEFEGFWRLRKKYDIIIGNRAKREDGICRRLISFGVSFILFAVLKVRVKDANTPYRMMRGYALAAALKYINKKEAVPNIMLSAIFKRKHYRLIYKDISFRKRGAGKNSINILKIIKMGTRAVGRFIMLDKSLCADNL